MKSLIAAAILLTLLASDPAPAQERPGGRRFGPAGTARLAPKQASAPNSSPQAPGGHDGRRLEPMTAAERQQLRRDVNDHGREIYRDRSASSKR